MLLAVHEGARFLARQLHSIAAQEAVDWRLLISVDGSRDGSREICTAFAADHPPGRVQVTDGPRAGAAANFRQLLRQGAGSGLPLALADQDDVWFPDRLSRALSAISAQGPGPVLYGSRTLICREDLTPVSLSARPRRPLTFANALIQNVISGHTMVLNPDAARLVARADRVTGDIVIHDWWIYQLVTACGGRVIFDDQPGVRYRQHAGNAIGANTGPRASAARFMGMLAGDLRRWNDVNIAALRPVAGEMTAPARSMLETFDAARHQPLWRRLRGIWRSGVVRQGRLAQLSFWAAAVLGRL